MTAKTKTVGEKTRRRGERRGMEGMEGIEGIKDWRVGTASIPSPDSEPMVELVFDQEDEHGNPAAKLSPGGCLVVVDSRSCVKLPLNPGSVICTCILLEETGGDTVLIRRTRPNPDCDRSKPRKARKKDPRRRTVQTEPKSTLSASVDSSNRRKKNRKRSIRVSKRPKPVS